MKRVNQRWTHTLLALSLIAGSMCMVIAPRADASNMKAEVTTRSVQGTAEKGKSVEKKTYVVKLKKNVSANQFKGKKGLNERATKRTLKSNSITMELTEAEYQALVHDSDVMYVEPDYLISLTESESENNSYIESASVSDVTYNPQEIIPWGISAIGADLLDQPNQQGQGVKIAILDTGIAPHPDLNIAGGVSFVDGVNTYADDHGHGTHIAGIIGAQENGIGVVGAAPHAELYAVKVLDHQGKGTYSQVVQGIEWAIEQQVNILSLSLGGVEYSQVLHEAVQTARSQGILVVASAGNRSAGEETMTYPARYSESLSVGAVGENYERASFSSTGTELDIVAPGTNILSTDLNASYKETFGTSASAAYVSGAAASVWSAHPEWTSEQVEQQLKNTAFALGELSWYGSGIVNAARALGMHVEEPKPPAEELPVSQLDAWDEAKRALDQLQSKLFKMVRKAKQSNDNALIERVTSRYDELLARKKSLYRHIMNASKEIPEGSIANRLSEALYLNEEKYHLLTDDFEKAITEISSYISYNPEEDDQVFAQYYEDWYEFGYVSESSIIEVSHSYDDEYIEVVMMDFYPERTGKYRFYTMFYYNSDYNPMDLDLYEATSAGQIGDHVIGATGQADGMDMEADLIAGQHYIILLAADDPEYKVNAKLVIHPVVAGSPIQAASPVDIWEYDDDYNYPYEVFSFTPPASGVYNITTSSYGGSGPLFSDELRVYSDIGHYNQLASGTNQVSPSLNAGSSYQIRVLGDSEEVRARLTIMPTQQTDTQPPTVPTGLVVVSHTSNSAVLNWNASTDNYGVTGYNIYRNGTYVGTSNSTNYTVTGLAANTTHSFTVKAKDVVGRLSGTSNQANLYIDKQAPSAPANLHISNQSSNSITLTWTASTDNVGVTQYLIFNGAVQIGTSATTNFTISPLVASTNYSFSVKAKDVAGNISAASTVVQHSTGADSFTYVYDLAGRLDYIQFSSGKKIEYTFDANGNLKSITVINP